MAHSPVPLLADIPVQSALPISKQHCGLQRQYLWYWLQQHDTQVLLVLNKSNYKMLFLLILVLYYVASKKTEKVKFISGDSNNNNIKTNILWPYYWSTYVRRHFQLRTGVATQNRLINAWSCLHSSMQLLPTLVGCHHTPTQLATTVLAESSSLTEKNDDKKHTVYILQRTAND